MSAAVEADLPSISFEEVTDWYIPESDDGVQPIIVYPGAFVATGEVLEHAIKLRDLVMWQRSQGGDDLRDWRFDYSNLAFRCHRQRTVAGSMFMLRRISTRLPDLKRLGIPNELVKHLSAANFAEQGGLVLISGRPGHGKSTTAAAFILERVRTFGYYCLTVEDPPEFALHDSYPTKSGRVGMIVQVPANPESFSHDLKDALRCYPSNMRGSMLMVGEVRDSDTAAQLLRAAVNGQLVIATLHASDPVAALERVMALAKEVMGDSEAKSLLGHSLRAVMHQRLEGDKLHMTPLLSLDSNSSVSGRIKSGHLAQLSSDVQTQGTQLAHNRLLESLRAFSSRSGA